MMVYHKDVSFMLSSINKTINTERRKKRKRDISYNFLLFIDSSLVEIDKSQMKWTNRNGFECHFRLLWVCAKFNIIASERQFSLLNAMCLMSFVSTFIAFAVYILAFAAVFFYSPISLCLAIFFSIQPINFTFLQKKKTLKTFFLLTIVFLFIDSLSFSAETHADKKKATTTTIINNSKQIDTINWENDNCSYEEIITSFNFFFFFCSLLFEMSI